MPGDPHPFKTPYDDRSASGLLAAMKLHSRVQVADADEVRNTDFSDQYGGLYVRANSANYRLDTESTAEDDGENVIIDAAGTHFLKTTDAAAPVSIIYDDDDVVSGAITIGDDIDIAIIDVAASVDVNVPAAADRNGRRLLIKAIGDGGFTPVLDGSETIDGNAASGYEVATKGGHLDLTPVTGGYVLTGSQL